MSKKEKTKDDKAPDKPAVVLGLSSEKEDTTEKGTLPGTDIQKDKGKEKSFVNDVVVNGLLSESNPEISDLIKGISDYKSLKEEVNSEIKRIRTLLKPIKRNDKRLNGIPAGKPTDEKKIALELELELQKSRLIAIKEVIATLRKKLSAESSLASKRLSLQQLQDKAFSTAYTQRNEYMIKQKLLAVLNRILASGDEILRASFERVRKLAFMEGEEGVKEYIEAFAELLKNTEEKTYILSSGRLKNKLFGAVRLTLQNWNAQERSIAKLIFPEELADDKKPAPDPFEANAALIRSLILKHFNQSIKVNKDEVISLRNLAKDINKSDEFQNKLNDFIDNEDSDLFMIGAGGLRQRLNETLRLTLVNWQPELQMSIEEVVIAKAVN